MSALESFGGSSITLNFEAAVAESALKIPETVDPDY